MTLTDQRFVRLRPGNRACFFAFALASLYCLLGSAQITRAGTFPVTNNADAGGGSLRQAILDANSNPDADTITFNLPVGTGPIMLNAPLPNITGPVSILGESQPGSICNSSDPRGTDVKVALDGINAGTSAIGFSIGVSNVRVSGLNVRNFGGDNIRVLNASNVAIECNLIGTYDHGAGRQLLGDSGIVFLNQRPTPQRGNSISANLISGNNAHGIVISGTNLITVENNYIGADKAGQAGLGNGEHGLWVVGNAEPMLVQNNLLAANGSDAIRADGLANAAILSNSIGTDATGMTALPNAGDGLRLDSMSYGNTVRHNLISGNGGSGLSVQGSSNTVQFNRIGTTTDGAGALGNHGDGIQIAGGSNEVVSNLISANAQDGISITTAAGNVIAGNAIGTNEALTAALGNGGNGIHAGPGSNDNLITDNTLSGNAGAGVRLANSNTNQLYGNSIGSGAAEAQLGNHGSGILITDSTGNKIGGQDRTPNFIAYNLDKGIWIAGAASTGNWIAENSIYSNTGLGIDLAPVMLTPNDVGDADAGPNHLQNFPVLAGATSNGASTLVSGTLNSAGNARFLIEFFANPGADLDGTCEGASYVGSVLLTTNGGGSASFATPLDSVVPAGYLLSATAKNMDTADTSEFSACAAVTGATFPSTSVSLSPATLSVNEIEGAATLTVSLSTTTSVPITIHYSTRAALIPGPSDATPGDDYAAASHRSVAVPAGQLSATITIPIVNDPFVELTERFYVSIARPSSGLASLDLSQAQATVRILNNSAPNTPPVAYSQTVAAKMGAAKAITLTGWDANNNPLFFIISSQPLHGILSGNAPTVTYTPGPGFVGDDSFAFSTSDGAAVSEAATVDIVVTGAPRVVPNAVYLPTALTGGISAFGRQRME